MKTNMTTVTERGQVSIPVNIRKNMELEPGRKLVWEQVSENECRVMVVLESPDPLLMLGYANKVNGQAPRTTAEWMRELREGEQG